MDVDVSALLQRLDLLEKRVLSLETENAALRDENLRLKKKVGDLEARLGLSSKNSSKPPSTDPPQAVSKKGDIQKPDAPKNEQGAQPGHSGHARPWFPKDKVTRTEHVRPDACHQCHKSLVGQPDAQRPEQRQVVDLPVLRPEITEYHLHTLACPDCKALTTALPPADATTGTGPRALAWIATLSGQYRLSRDNVAHLMERLCGIPMCKGTVQNACMEVSEALKKPVAELERALPKQATVHLDETSWRQGGKLAWLWVAATKAYTVFAVNAKRDTEQVRKWYPEGYSGVAHSDRWSVYTRVFGESRHQVCWAHLLRDMQGIVDRGLCGKKPTAQVQEGMKKLFEGWGEYRRGEKTREKVQEETVEQQRAVEAWAQAGSEQKEDGKWRGVGKWLMKWKGSVFRFLWEEGVEPTNNAAEQAVRSGVIWRRGSGGTKSAAGSDFVARILSVGATCRQQGKEVSEYLTEALRAWRAGEPAPSLLPA